MASHCSSNRSLLSLALFLGALASVARGQQGTSSASSGGMLANIPGARTAAGVLASSANGLSRYLARDGPIQPGVSAFVGGLPMRGAELANRGISSISDRLDAGAQSLSRAAGNADGDTSMPGLEALESSMPASVMGLGNMAGDMISKKNAFIRRQAEQGAQAAERLMSMMHSGQQKMMARSSGHMVGAANMMSSAQDSLARSASQIQSQLKESLDGSLGRLKSMQGMGDDMRNQMHGIAQTLQNGLTGTIDHLQRTGQQVVGQIQGNMQKNNRAMSGILGSMHGSMDKAGQNMQKNLHQVLRQAQDAVHQVSGQLQQAVAGPLSMLQNLGGSLGSMMKGGSHMSGGGGGGRY